MADNTYNHGNRPVAVQNTVPTEKGMILTPQAANPVGPSRGLYGKTDGNLYYFDGTVEIKLTDSGAPSGGGAITVEQDGVPISTAATFLNFKNDFLVASPSLHHIDINLKYLDQSVLNTIKPSADATIDLGANLVRFKDFYSTGTLFGGIGGPMGLKSGIADGASAVAFNLDTAHALATSGAKLFVLKNNGVEKFSVDKDGNVTIQGDLDLSTVSALRSNTSMSFQVDADNNGNESFTWLDGTMTILMELDEVAGQLTLAGKLKSYQPDGASAKAFELDTLYTLSTPGAKLLALKNNGSLAFFIDVLGNVNAGSGSFTGGSLMPASHNAYDIGAGLVRYRDIYYAGTLYGGNSPMSMMSKETDGGSAIGYNLDTANSLSTPGAKLLSLKNNGVEKFAVDFAGTLYGPVNPMVLQSREPDGLTAIGFDLNTANTIATGGSKLLRLRSNGSERLSLRQGTDLAGNANASLLELYDNLGAMRLQIGTCPGFFPGKTFTGIYSKASDAFNIGHINDWTFAPGYRSSSIDSDLASSSPSLALDCTWDGKWESYIYLTADTPGIAISSTDRVSGENTFIFMTPSSLGGHGHIDLNLDMTMGTKAYLGLAADGSFIGGNAAVPTKWRFESGAGDGATAIGFELDTLNAFATSGAKLLSIKNQGIEQLYIDKDGILTGALSTLKLKSEVVDGASAIGIKLDTLNALITDGSKILSLQNAGIEAFDIRRGNDTSGYSSDQNLIEFRDTTGALVATLIAGTDPQLSLIGNGVPLFLMSHPGSFGDQGSLLLQANTTTLEAKASSTDAFSYVKASRPALHGSVASLEAHLTLTGNLPFVAMHANYNGDDLRHTFVKAEALSANEQKITLEALNTALTKNAHTLVALDSSAVPYVQTDITESGQTHSTLLKSAQFQVLVNSVQKLLVDTTGISVNGGIDVLRHSTAVSAPSAGEVIIGVTDTTAPRTITLVAADYVAGRLAIIKDESGAATPTNYIRVTPSSGTIDGAGYVDITASYGCLRLYCNGTDWFSW